ncbi:substrate-binding domain-containing protein [Fontivita pretiosa]|uniref:substrate-binding domain-containing protein n=1 Tax=Fontivita pretiosa TaxID=2989684 RepID=UPI003D17E0D0
MNRPVTTRSRRRRRVLLAMGFLSPERQAGIVRYARQAGWIVDWSLPRYHAVGEDQQYLHASQYDGVLALCSKASPWLPELLRNFTVPVVDMWSDYPQEPFPRVLLDNVAIGRAAANHLLSRGFRNLLFYTHAIEAKAAEARYEGFAQAARAAGAEVRQLNWDHRAGPRGRQARAAWLAGWLSRAELPLGVMGSNDPIACEVLEAAELAGLAVPGQVAVIGVDNDPAVTELASVPLSSVDSAREHAGYAAAALLDRLMNGAAAPGQPILIQPGPVIARRSTDALAVRDPRVAAAIQFIQDHFHEPITAEQVAAGAGVSRRWLQSRILVHTGRTIHQTITWQRIEHAQRLLVGTRMKIQLVASQCGFGTGENLCKVFHRRVGMTPQQYRERYLSSEARSGVIDAGLPDRTDELPKMPMQLP